MPKPVHASDNKLVQPAAKDGVTWGMLFGRTPPINEGKEIFLQKVSVQDGYRAIACSHLLLAQQHVKDCPARHGASVSCCIPLACCVFADFQLLDDPK